MPAAGYQFNETMQIYNYKKYANSILPQFIDNDTRIQSYSNRLNIDLTSASDFLSWDMADMKLTALTSPSVEEILDIAFNTRFLNEVEACAYILDFFEAEDEIDFREDLLKHIAFQNLEKLRIKILIDGTNLRDSINRRSIAGKSNNEIELDSEYFKDIAAKASSIYDRL